MMPYSLPRDIHLTDAQTAELIGTNPGRFCSMRIRGCKAFDPSFPPRKNGGFSAIAVLAWLNASNASNARAALTAAPAPPEK